MGLRGKKSSRVLIRNHNPPPPTIQVFYLLSSPTYFTGIYLTLVFFLSDPCNDNLNKLAASEQNLSK